MRSFVFAAAAAVLATSAFAQSSSPPAATPAQPNAAAQSQSGAKGQQAQMGQQGTKVSSATQKFVEKVAISDMFEIQSGQIAQQKATNDAYKQFGQMVRDDHTKTSDQLKSLAQNMPGLQLPTALDAAHKQKLDKLQTLSGAQFEDQFKKDQVAGHEDAVKLFQKYSNKGDKADLKKFAQDTLPKLKEHLQHAQALPKGGAAQTMGTAPAGGAQPQPANQPKR
jgi:putative membrane protein